VCSECTNTMKKPKDSQQLLAKKRERRRLDALRSGNRAYIPAGWGDDAEKGSLSRESAGEVGPAPQRSKSLEMLLHCTPKNYFASKISSRVRIEVPQVFSVIRNPAETVRTIYRVASLARSDRIKNFYIDHSEVKLIELAAESVLDRTLLDVTHDFNRRRRRVDGHGKIPTDPTLNRFLRAVGIVDSMNVTELMLSEEEERQIRVFKKQSKYAERLKRLDVTDFKEAVLIKLDEYINRCLNEHGWELTQKARSDLAGYAGEILGNAEDHSGFDDWTVVGYLDKNKDTDTHWCELAIFNYGATVSETFDDLPRSSYPWKTISPYIEAHAQKGLFSSNWKKDDLITVAALQGHVSSKNRSPDDTRGRGTVDLIEFFQQMCDGFSLSEGEQVEMAILSGATHIYFDGKYRIAASITDPRPIIAFNDKNDLLEPPDPAYVRNLGSFWFPGCIISIRFPIPTSHLQAASREQRKENNPS